MVWARLSPAGLKAAYEGASIRTEADTAAAALRIRLVLLCAAA
jgi:hypothetical protein